MRATQAFRELVRVTLVRHRVAAVVCASLTALLGAAVMWAAPTRWVSRADVYITEPVAVHRIANPFSPIPSQKEELATLPAVLFSKESLVAIAKRADLVDQWAASRSAPMRIVDRVRQLLGGVPGDSDVLEVLTQMLEARMGVFVEGNHLNIVVQWPSPDAAWAVVHAALSIVQQYRESSTIRTLEESGADLDERLAGKRVEIRSRLERIEAELSRAAAEDRIASIDADHHQLTIDRARAAELEETQGDNRITLDVMRRTNAMRFIVVTPPEVPKEPFGAPFSVEVLVFVIVVAISGFAGAFALTIAGGQAVSGRQIERTAGLKVLASLPTTSRGAAERPRRGALALVFALAALTGLAVGVARGNIALALAPLIAALGLWLLWTMPLKWPLLGLMLLAVTIDDPADRPFADLWRSPLYPVGKIFYHNVAWLTGFELSLVGLALIMFFRRVAGSGRRAAALDPQGGQAPRALRIGLVISAGTLVWLIVMGAARGGDFREALWQFRSLLVLPLVAMLALHSFDFPKDLKLLFRVLVIGSLLKAFLGAFFIYVLAAPAGWDPPHTTGHADTMIFVVATMVALLLVWERPTWRHMGAFLPWAALMFLAMVLNDRRVAYVDLGVAFLFLFILSPMHRFKLAFVRAIVALSPVLILYGTVGWFSHGNPVFAPVAKIKSIFAPAENSEEESSNVERDIENYNIMKSWEGGTFFGQGFGHAFTEFVPGNDFSQSRFGHIGHNSVLWLLWIGGLFGFVSVLFYLGLTSYFLVRTLKVTNEWKERVALFASLTIMLTYVLQAFFDMGLVSTQYDFFVGAAVGIVGRLAVRYRVLDQRLGGPRRQLPEPLRVQVSGASG